VLLKTSWNGDLPSESSRYQIQMTWVKLDRSVYRAGTEMKLTLVLLVLLSFLGGCNPTVKVEAPDKPIEINLNVKIEHNIRLQVDRELADLFEEDSEVF
jgi:hypothetical protein